MPSRKQTAGSDPEILAIGLVNDALKDLDPAARERVLAYVQGKFGITSSVADDMQRVRAVSTEPTPQQPPTPETAESEETEGISPVALKWMRRNAFTASGLSKLFSLGADEIDFIANEVPGDNKKERAHNVVLLKAIAAYLSTGAARVTHDQVKETCLHYDAYDGNNFSAYLRSFAAEVGGSKESGYTLTARGLTAATELLKKILTAK